MNGVLHKEHALLGENISFKIVMLHMYINIYMYR